MSGSGLFIRVGDEGFLSGHGQGFPPRPRKDLSPVGSEPLVVAIGLLVPGPGSRPRDRIRVIQPLHGQQIFAHFSPPYGFAFLFSS
jgi:hypothetical protein